RGPRRGAGPRGGAEGDPGPARAQRREPGERWYARGNTNLGYGARENTADAQGAFRPYQQRQLLSQWATPRHGFYRQNREGLERRERRGNADVAGPWAGRYERGV